MWRAGGETAIGATSGEEPMTGRRFAWALVAAYLGGCALAVVAGVCFGDGLTQKPPCLPGMTLVALDGNVWCMPDTKLMQLSNGYCGATGTYAKGPGGTLRLDECVDRER
jgi:hypothetical protein